MATDSKKIVKLVLEIIKYGITLIIGALGGNAIL